MEIIHKTPEGEVKREAAPTGFQKIVILGQDGNQKEVPVRVDEEGRLVLVADIELGEVDVNIGEVEQGAVGPNAEPWMTKLTDATGDPISSANPLPTQLTGQIPIYENIVNAVSVPAGGSHDVTINVTDESEIWLFVRTNRQPWRVRTTVSWNTATPDYRGTYPDLWGSQVTTHGTNNPKPALLVGTVGTVILEDGGLNTWAEALEAVRPFHFQPRVRFTNLHLTDVATYSLNIMRVWR